ncbi:MAG: hypothetical protein GKR90_14060 [Pseudomonadales bacterium]|nr:hypothetical protein [Pseudomonadales bacterium]
MSENDNIGEAPRWEGKNRTPLFVNEMVAEGEVPAQWQGANRSHLFTPGEKDPEDHQADMTVAAIVAVCLVLLLLV